MAVAMTIVAKEKFINGFRLYVNLALTGSYTVTTGEPADFSTLAAVNNRQPRHVFITCKDSAIVYTYDKAQKSIRVWTNSAGGANGVLTEHTTAAYIASILADTQIEAVATFIYG